MPLESDKIRTTVLRRMIRKAGYTISSFGRKAGISKEAMRSYTSTKSPTASINPDFLRRISESLEVAIDELRARGPIEDPVREIKELLSRAPAAIDPNSYTDATIPEWEIDLRASVWASMPCTMLDMKDPEQAGVWRAGRFRLRLAGSCMEPEYYDGQLIQFEMIRVDRDGLELNADYCVCKFDETATFKRLVGFDDDSYTLAAINQKDYPGVLVVARQEVCRMARVEWRFNPPPVPKVLKIGKVRK